MYKTHLLQFHEEIYVGIGESVFIKKKKKKNSMTTSPSVFFFSFFFYYYYD